MNIDDADQVLAKIKQSDSDRLMAKLRAVINGEDVMHATTCCLVQAALLIRLCCNGDRTKEMELFDGLVDHVKHEFWAN